MTGKNKRTAAYPDLSIIDPPRLTAASSDGKTLAVTRSRFSKDSDTSWKRVESYIRDKGLQLLHEAPVQTQFGPCVYRIYVTPAFRMTANDFAAGRYDGARFRAVRADGKAVTWVNKRGAR